MSRSTHHRASLARRIQSYPPGHPKVVEAKRNLNEAKIADYIERALAEAPPLTDEQRSKLAELLKPAREAITQARLAELGAGDGAA
jgi:hypothetical protein